VVQTILQGRVKFPTGGHNPPALKKCRPGEIPGSTVQSG
jgi:hypothetical protein